MKAKRSERLVDMTHYLLEHPFDIISLTYFAELYQAAKSSISEDLNIIKERFVRLGIGDLETFVGATGGVRYIPTVDSEQQHRLIAELVEELDGSERLLPGGFVYLSDVLGQPKWLNHIGRVIASRYMDEDVDTVMTVATSGIPIAQSVARFLNVPFTIVTRDPKVTEGSTVSVNYVSGSDHTRVEKMELAKRSLAEGSKVVVVDDFVRSGGTIEGMRALLDEFNATLIGTTVVVENIVGKSSVSANYRSLIQISDVDEQKNTIQVKLGDFFDA